MIGRRRAWRLFRRFWIVLGVMVHVGLLTWGFIAYRATHDARQALEGNARVTVTRGAQATAARQTRSRESMLMALPRRTLYATSSSRSATIFSTYSLEFGHVVSECG